MSDEFVAQFAAADVDRKIALLEALRPPLDSDVLRLLADALADERRRLEGPRGWEELGDSVNYAAKRVLASAGPAAESALVPKLDDPSQACRDHALDLLIDLPALAPATIDALLGHAADPTLAYRVGLALRGKLDTRPLLDVPETRLAGFTACLELEPVWLVELLGDPLLRRDVLGRIGELEPPPDELVPLVQPLLDDPDASVAYGAFRALAHLANEDAAVTATLIAAVHRHDREHTAWWLLARRPLRHLRAHLPELLAALPRTSYAALPLGALGPSAPVEVALALGRQLVAGHTGEIVLALEKLGVAALPALPMAIAAAQDLDDEWAREDAAGLPSLPT